MSALTYWWSRFGNYSPGLYNLPHMGEVISDYRKKRKLRTQNDFAVASGFDKRTIQEWEVAVMIMDVGRRIFLARLLKVPPVLLGLQWRQVYGDAPQDEQNSSWESLVELVEEDAFYTYEDILAIGWESSFVGGPPEIDARIERRLKKLEAIVKQVREPEKEAWQTLLIGYYLLARSFAQQHRSDVSRAQQLTTSAIQLAKEMNDNQMLALAFSHSTYTTLQRKGPKEAKSDIIAALDLVGRGQVQSVPLIGNIYLQAADVHGYDAINDRKLQEQCKAWQEKAANLAYTHKGSTKSDPTFFKFNISAVNHEKAKLLLRFARKEGTKQDYAISEANASAITSKLNAAWKTLGSDLTAWKIGYALTEARLYQASHDLEGSARLAYEALTIARSMNNRKSENEVKSLYFELGKKGTNPYVLNLGVELGVF